jgi:D-alanyl-D-alanine carboxypeptidase/D-alanyl-D-alanine-endopeptidase (penicillin-binding protein 4)
LITGTIPVNQSSFSISGAVFDPALNLSNDLARALMRNSVNNGSLRRSAGYEERLDSTVMRNMKVIGEHVSPPLDSINYWFLRRSINLYGEALVKTLAYDKTGFGTTSKGVELVRDFWQVHGIEKAAIHIMDGSGLSPQNRVTTDALVKVLQYAKTRSWYSSFYNALPEYNGMKMKSGSISGARAFAGYHTAKDGKEYSYAIIVNNYDGSSGEAVKKLYRLLDVLK